MVDENALKKDTVDGKEKNEVLSKKEKTNPKKETTIDVAVISSGSKQYIVQEGTVISLEKIDTTEKTIDFEHVLAAQIKDDIFIGTPFVDQVTVKADILSQERDSKVVAFKFKPKTGYRKKQGHRQYMTTVKIKSIALKSNKQASPSKKST